MSHLNSLSLTGEGEEQAMIVQRKSRLVGLRKLVTVLSFLAPALFFYGVFILYPIVKAVQLSFFDWNGNTEHMNFVGLQNYTTIIKDQIFINALLHNIYWVLLECVLVIIPVLILATMISSVKKGKMFFRSAFYLPAVLSLPVVAVIWGKIYDPFIGPINALLKMVGLPQMALNWLGDPVTVLPSLVVASVWVAYGFYMVLYLAGLQSIDYTLYEAADIDGASKKDKFIHVTLPSLRNIMNLVISMIIINSLKSFSMVWIITQGGPFYKSEVVATYVYKAAFSMFKVSYGAAGSVILAIIVIVVTVLFNYLRERKEN